MTSGTGSSSGGISEDKKQQLLKIIGAALISIISVICGVEIGGII